LTGIIRVHLQLFSGEVPVCHHSR